MKQYFFIEFDANFSKRSLSFEKRLRFSIFNISIINSKLKFNEEENSIVFSCTSKIWFKALMSNWVQFSLCKEKSTASSIKVSHFSTLFIGHNEHAIGPETIVPWRKVNDTRYLSPAKRTNTLSCCERAYFRFRAPTCDIARFPSDEHRSVQKSTIACGNRSTALRL